MHGFLRRSLIAFLTLALIASGTTWRQCMAAAHAHATSAAAPSHSEHTSHHEHAARYDHRHAAIDGAKQPVDDNACLKCCPMCTVTVTPFVVDQIIAFPVSSVVFFLASANLSGQVVCIDPGIPKHVV